MGRAATIYYCSYENCTASFNRKHRYETHLRSHTGDRPFVCSHEDCEKSFASSSHLRRHEKTHGSSYRCTMENCCEILKTKSTLNKHLKTVHLKIKKQKVYACTLCDREFSKHKTLQWHELRHSGELPHKCSVEDCQKSFLTPSKLKRHMKVHEGYPCKKPNCDKIFEKWSLYVQHVRDCHRSEYKCRVCSNVFSTSHALKLHTPIHDETRFVYPCQVPNCSRYYYAKKNLNFHMKKYHAKRPYMCDKENCHKAFKTEVDLAEHILYHGKKKPRKKKIKPKKPSLAALLSGVAVPKQISRKAKSVLIEQEVETNVPISSSTKINSIRLESNHASSLEEINVCYTKLLEGLDSQENCTDSQSITSEDFNIPFAQNKNETIMESEVTQLSSEENILELHESVAAKESDCAGFEKNLPMECEIGESVTELKVPEAAVQEYTTIEIVDGGKLSSVISVPIIKMDKHWSESAAVHIETVS